MPSSTMNRCLPDINVWLAIAFDRKKEHAAAKAWFDTQADDSCFFCRYTQQGFLRLCSNASMFGEDAKTMPEAWRMLDEFLDDLRVGFLDEPQDLATQWRAYAHRPLKATNLWNDAFLAAFAKAWEFEVVTFDTDFRSFPDLNCTILTS